MNWKYIKTLNHLKNSLEYNVIVPFFMGNFEYEPIEGEVIKLSIENKDYLLLFNNHLSDGDKSIYNISTYIDDECLGKIEMLRRKYRELVLLHYFDEDEIFFLSRYFPFIITSETFICDYDKFSNDNKKVLSNIFEIYGKDNSFCKLIYLLTNGSSNMFLWALTNLRKHTPFYLISEILYWFREYKTFVGKVSKGTFTAYNDTKSILSLRNELILLRQEKRIAKVFNMFNTYQKKLLKNATLTNFQKEMVSRFETISKEKQINFIRKVSTFETIEEIFHQMAILTKNHFDWNRDSFLEFITNIDNLSFDVVYDESNIIILNVKDYETVKYVTRTTNWCISKNKAYWNNYMEKGNKLKSKQYVLFNFNEKEDSEYSIVGFTTSNDMSISHAHSFTNNNLIVKESRIGTQLTSYVQPSVINIQKLLSNLHIPLDNIIINDSLPYVWDKSSLLVILSTIDEYNYDIIKNEGDILVFTIKSSQDIVRITGVNQYAKMLNFTLNNPISYTHLFICDFSKNDDNKLLWTFAYDFTENEINYSLFNSKGYKCDKSLYHVLYEYNLPFDIFCNPISMVDIFVNAFETYDMKLLDILLSDKNAIKFLKNKKVKNSISDSIICSLYHHHSFDVINLIYSKGLLLSNLIDDSFVNKLLSKTLAYINISDVPSKKDYDKLFSYKINKYCIDAYANFYLFELIWNNEKKPELIKDWFVNMSCIDSPKVLRYFIDCIKPYFNDIVSKVKINVIANAIIKAEYFDVLSNDLNDILTKEVNDILNVVKKEAS